MWSKIRRLISKESSLVPRLLCSGTRNWTGACGESLVSCPDPTLSRGKGSGDHRVISWLCLVSRLDTEQPNEIALRHATMCLTDRPICNFVPRPYPRLCCATQVTWLMAFCWLGTTKILLNGHLTPFLVKGRSLGTRLERAWYFFLTWGPSKVERR